MNHIEMTLLCEECEGDCGGAACALKRHSAEAHSKEIAVADKS